MMYLPRPLPVPLDKGNAGSGNEIAGGYTSSNMLSIKVKFNFRWKSLTSQFLGKYSLFFENSFFVFKNLLSNESIRESAKRGHCTRAEQECCSMTDSKQ